MIPRGVRFRVELPDGTGARLCLRELRRAVPPAGPRPDRLQRPGQSARFPDACGRATRTAKATSSWSPSSSATVVGGASTIRRSTWSPGTATTRRTNTTCAASTPSARSASIIRTRRSSSCCSRRATRRASTTSTSSSSRRAGWPMEHTFRPPWFHRNVASEFMGLIHGAYDAKAEGFAPGGASLHNCMSGHGPDAETFEKAIARRHVASRSKISDTMAFMFETRSVIHPTRFALETAQLQHELLPLLAGSGRTLRSAAALATVNGYDTGTRSEHRGTMTYREHPGRNAWTRRLHPAEPAAAPQRAERRARRRAGVALHGFDARSGDRRHRHHRQRQGVRCRRRHRRDGRMGLRRKCMPTTTSCAGNRSGAPASR